jgi:hypothetical protein
MNIAKRHPERLGEGYRLWKKRKLKVVADWNKDGLTLTKWRRQHVTVQTRVPPIFILLDGRPRQCDL